MSRIGKVPVPVPAGVTVKVENGVVSVQGKLGTLTFKLPRGITAKVDGPKVVVDRTSDDRVVHGCHGLVRTLVRNMIQGVQTYYEKDLEIEGVGFKAAVSGQKVSLSLGYASPKVYNVPAGVKVAADADGLRINVKGCDKQLVGMVAAEIRSYFPAEPYKGKGIKYKGEKIRRKEGKTVA